VDLFANKLYRLKLKRPQTAKMYRTAIDEMYAEVEAGSTTKAKL
jgi:long-chain acyl-CoA synthetase